MRLKLITAAAAIAAATSAQAGDLAHPAPPAVDYVKICDAYGAGFFYIPGTETCLKIGGYVRSEHRVGDADFGPFGYTGPLSWDERFRNGIYHRVRTSLTFDARTNTEYGLLRSFVEWWFQVDTGSSSATPVLWQGFIQFGGLVAGRTQSFYDFWTGYTYGSVFQNAYSDLKINLLAYQFSFGNGVSATISLEDSTTGSDPRRFFNDNPPTSAYGGQRYPDLVANIRVDQAWGSAQIMGALHQVIPSDSAYDKELGWAIGAGVQINLPWISPGSAFAIQANYAKGAVSYVHDTWVPGATDYRIFGNTELTEAWGIAVGYKHVFNPKWTLALQASYADHDAEGDRNDFNQWDAQAALSYTIVPGMLIGLSVEYRRAEYDRFAPAGGDCKTCDAWIGLLRFQRTF